MSKKAGVGLLGFVLYLASALVSLISQQRQIAWGVFLGGAVVYLLMQFWFLRKPPSIQEVGQKSACIALVLRAIKHDYLEHLQMAGVTPPANVRLSIMVPQARSIFATAATIRILYVDELRLFSDEEIEDVWKRGEGKCGLAWKNGKQAFFAADLHSADGCMVAMSHEKYQRYSKLNSVLSTPVFSGTGAIIGVLSMDSEDGASCTRVSDNAIQSIFQVAAQQIVSLLPEGGVQW